MIDWKSFEKEYKVINTQFYYDTESAICKELLKEYYKEYYKELFKTVNPENLTNAEIEKLSDEEYRKICKT